jgi:RHS repeat-associated protein
VRIYNRVLNTSEIAGLAGSTVRYVYGHKLISQKRGASTWYYGHDALGSVRYLTDSAGTISDTYNYDAFGIQIGGYASTPNNYRFAGEQWDSHLGLYYNRARYYDPNTGRFWTMDTFEGSPSDPKSLHKYLYANADPVNNVDPSGTATDGLGGLMASISGVSALAANVGIRALPLINRATVLLFEEATGESVLVGGRCTCGRGCARKGARRTRNLDESRGRIERRPVRNKSIPVGDSSQNRPAG